MSCKHVFAGVFALSCVAGAVASDGCSGIASAKANVESLQADLEAGSEERKARLADYDAKLNAIADERVRSGRWSDQDRVDFFASLPARPEFAELDATKKKVVQGFAMATEVMWRSQEQGDYAAACDAANSVREFAGKISAFQADKRALTLKTILAVE